MKQPTALALVSIALLPGPTAVHAQSVETPSERPLAERVEGRTFPSVFQAWNPAQNVQDDSPWHTVARHGLFFHAPHFFGLQWNRHPIGLADGFTPESIQRGRLVRQGLLALNPDLVLLAEIRYRDAPKRYLPEGQEWWLRDNNGKIVPGWDEGNFLCFDFGDPEFRRHVAKQCKAAVDSGVVDGVMLDWWSDDADRLALIKEVRAVLVQRIYVPRLGGIRCPSFHPMGL